MANESCGKWYKGYKHQIKDCYPEKPSITKLDVVERVIMSNPKKPQDYETYCITPNKWQQPK
jgi:hypothetical protein